LTLLGVPLLGLFSHRIGTIFGILSRRAGLSATAGLSCYLLAACRSFNWFIYCDVWYGE